MKGLKGILVRKPSVGPSIELRVEILEENLEVAQGHITRLYQRIEELEKLLNHKPVCYAKPLR